MNVLEVILTVAAVGSLISAFLAKRELKTAYKEHDTTLEYLLKKLQKAKYDADKEYDSTGWAPVSDKPDGKD